MDADESSAAMPQPLPLRHPMEERAGERRSVSNSCFLRMPLSSILSPLVPRGERKQKPFAKSLAKLRELSFLQYRFWQRNQLHLSGADAALDGCFRSVSIGVHLRFQVLFSSSSVFQFVRGLFELSIKLPQQLAAQGQRAARRAKAQSPSPLEFWRQQLQPELHKPAIEFNFHFSLISCQSSVVRCHGNPSRIHPL